MLIIGIRISLSLDDNGASGSEVDNRYNGERFINHVNNQREYTMTKDVMNTKVFDYLIKGRHQNTYSTKE